MGKKIPNEVLIAELKQLAKKLGRTPRSVEYPRSRTAEKRFGGWNQFLEVAGFEINSRFEKLSKQELIEKAQLQYHNTGKPVTYQNFKYSQTAQTKFDGWSNFLIAAGLKEPSKKSKKYEYKNRKTYSDQDLYGEINELAIKLNRIPKVKQYKRNIMVHKRFGSWTVFLEKAGLLSKEYLIKEFIAHTEEKELNPALKGFRLKKKAVEEFGSWNDFLNAVRKSQMSKKYSEEFLIAEVKKLGEKVKRTPKFKEFPYARTAATTFKSWNNFLKMAGFEKIRKWEKMDFEESRIEVQNLAEKLGHTPTQHEFGYSKAQAIANKYGGWNNFLVSCGLKPTIVSHTKESLLSHVRLLSKELGRTPSISEFPYGGSVRNYFDSWDSFVEEAGLEKYKKKCAISEDDLIRAIRQLANKLQRVPKTHEFKRYGVAKKKFNSWQNFLIAAGLEISKNRKKQYTDEFLIYEIKNLEKTLGRPPRRAEFKHASAACNAFGTWKEFLESAGLQSSKYTNDFLIREIQELANTLGRTPTIREYSMSKYPIVTRQFKSWSNFLKAADLKISKKRKKRYTNEFLFSEVNELAKNLGRIPKIMEYKRRYIVYERFGSWSNFLKAAGLKTCDKKCLICGNPVKDKRSNYCSRKCYAKARQHTKKCKICGKTFDVPPSSEKICCSKECSIANRKELQEAGIYNKTNEKWLDKKEEYFSNHKREKHPNAKSWTIKSPRGKVYEITNLKNFITMNLYLFEGSTVRQVLDGFIKIKASELGKRKRPVHSYKGWTLISWRDKK